jgi:hypothetical protein
LSHHYLAAGMGERCYAIDALGEPDWFGGLAWNRGCGRVASALPLLGQKGGGIYARHAA